MKVGGGLCLIEVTGKIEGPPGAAESGPSRNITAIYLDGTQAQSTILRWAQSDSETLWQAVHFTTKNLYIDLNSQPKQHFLDNLKIEHISFIKPGAPDQEAEEQREESRAYLCDIRPGPRAHVASDAPETHQRIIDFFTGPANKSKSTQPFGEVVARLNDSNASSMSLKMALSEFTLAKVCSSSNLFSGTSEAEGALDGGRGSKGGKVKQWLNFVTSEVGGLDVDETRNIVLDSACFGGLKAYKYSVAYGLANICCSSPFSCCCSACSWHSTSRRRARESLASRPLSACSTRSTCSRRS
jgi:hypothetical protein